MADFKAQLQRATAQLAQPGKAFFSATDGGPLEMPFYQSG